MNGWVPPVRFRGWFPAFGFSHFPQTQRAFVTRSRHSVSRLRTALDEAEDFAEGLLQAGSHGDKPPPPHLVFPSKKKGSGREDMFKQFLFGPWFFEGLRFWSGLWDASLMWMKIVASLFQVPNSSNNNPFFHFPNVKRKNPEEKYISHFLFILEEMEICTFSPPTPPQVSPHKNPNQCLKSSPSQSLRIQRLCCVFLVNLETSMFFLIQVLIPSPKTMWRWWKLANWLEDCPNLCCQQIWFLGKFSSETSSAKTKFLKGQLMPPPEVQKKVTPSPYSPSVFLSSRCITFFLVVVFWLFLFFAVWCGNS